MCAEGPGAGTQWAVSMWGGGEGSPGDGMGMEWEKEEEQKALVPAASWGELRHGRRASAGATLGAMLLKGHQ